MYNDSTGKTIFCNSEMNKSAKEGDTTTTAGCTVPSYSYSPYPGGSYTPYPTTTGTSGSCPSGSHNMGSYCMSDSDGTKCGPFNSSSTSGWGSNSCTAYNTSTYSPYPSPSSGGSYTPYPTTTGTSSSCRSGSHNMGSYCMSDYDGTKCASFGATSVSTFGSCSYFSGSSSYTPYPSTGGSSYTPPPSCPSDQWWDYSSNSCKLSTYSYSPAPGDSYTPYPTYSSTPYPTTEATTTTTTTTTTTLPPTTTTVYSPPPPESTTTTLPPSGFDSKAHQMAMARTIMACADSGGSWNAGTANCKSANSGFFANVLKIFSRFIR